MSLWNLIMKKTIQNYPNNLNYITTKFIKTFCNYFLKSKVKNSQQWYLLGRTSGGFCDIDLHFVVVLLHVPFFFIHIFFSTSSLTFPWTIARFLDPFCTFCPAHRRVICNTFIFQPFRYFLSTSATVFRGHFLPTGVFYLTLLPNILEQPAFIKVSVGASSYFLEICRASYWSSKHRSGISFCLIQSNLQSCIHFKFVFMHVNITNVLLVVKTLIKK